MNFGGEIVDDGVDYGVFVGVMYVECFFVYVE